MKKILVDFDNTMGLKDKPLDDGLTLMYLLGREDVEIIGVTTTFGNGNIDDVHNATLAMFNDLNISNIPLHKGSDINQDRISDASNFIVKMVNKYPNEVTILGLGSLANLYGAYLIDKDFYKKVGEIVLMGGITKPLMINRKLMNELNFSCDHEATYNVLTSGYNLFDVGCKLTIMTGHIGLQAGFGKEVYDVLNSNSEINTYTYIKEKAYTWTEYVLKHHDRPVFYNWDIVSAMYITNPELFDENYRNVVSSMNDLKSGYLRMDNDADENDYKINIPSGIKDVELFNEIIFEAWKNVKMNS